jgi:methanogenic corrinoid protein MtbC1
VAFPHQLREARRLIDGLDDRIGSGRPLVMVGGLAFGRAEQLLAVVGADALMRDPVAAVDYASAALAA